MRCCEICRDEMYPEIERHTVEFGIICDVCYDELEEEGRIRTVYIQGGI